MPDDNSKNMQLSDEDVRDLFNNLKRNLATESMSKDSEPSTTKDTPYAEIRAAYTEAGGDPNELDRALESSFRAKKQARALQVERALQAAKNKQITTTVAGWTLLCGLTCGVLGAMVCGVGWQRVLVLLALPAALVFNAVVPCKDWMGFSADERRGIGYVSYVLIFICWLCRSETWVWWASVAGSRDDVLYVGAITGVIGIVVGLIIGVSKAQAV